jgi:GAF domain-containing protein
MDGVGERPPDERTPDERPPDELEQTLGQLSRLLLSDDDLDGPMSAIARLSVAAIPACDACSVSEVDDRRVVTRVASDSVARRLDEYQYDNDDGPGLDAIRTGQPFRIDSIGQEVRWPTFVARAAQEGLQSSYSVPLTVDKEAVGCLNLYSLRSPFQDHDQRVGEAFGLQAAVTLANAKAYQRSLDLSQNLRVALESRDIIGQAKGIIMERERCTAGRAFDVLRSISQEHNIKLRDLAQRVVDTGSWTDFQS